MAKEKKKKVKEPFWKKWGPEAKHVTEHVGNIVNNSKLSDVTGALIDLGLAYYGVKAFGHIGGALIGPISMRLATSNNIIAGGAGVAGLGIMGLASTGRIQDIVEALLDPNIMLIDGERYTREEVIAPSFSPDWPFELVCPEGYDLKRGPSAAFCVLRR